VEVTKKMNFKRGGKGEEEKRGKGYERVAAKFGDFLGREGDAKKDWDWVRNVVKETKRENVKREDGKLALGRGEGGGE